MNWLKISGLSGILAPFVAFPLILLSIAYSPSFSWTENALSDLGVQEGVTAVLFNTSLIISGILAFFFAAGMFTFLHENLLGRTGAFVFIIDTIALTGIGIFPENVKPIHHYVSLIFFILFPVSMLLISAFFLRTSKIRIGLYTLVTAAVAAVVWMIPFGKGVAIPETLSVLSASAWSIFLGSKMHRESAT